MEAPKGGVLTIETLHPSQKDTVFIRFKDTGTGILRKDLPKIFDPFFTKKKKGKGVGLGLSVAYGIVQEHGGSINVRSIEGKGDTCKVDAVAGQYHPVIFYILTDFFDGRIFQHRPEPIQHRIEVELFGSTEIIVFAGNIECLMGTQCK